jgi:hypothetical protein
MSLGNYNLQQWHHYILKSQTPTKANADENPCIATATLEEFTVIQAKRDFTIWSSNIFLPFTQTCWEFVWPLKIAMFIAALFIIARE